MSTYFLNKVCAAVFWYAALRTKDREDLYARRRKIATKKKEPRNRLFYGIGDQVDNSERRHKEEKNKLAPGDNSMRNSMTSRKRGTDRNSNKDSDKGTGGDTHTYTGIDAQELKRGGRTARTKGNNRHECEQCHRESYGQAFVYAKSFHLDRGGAYKQPSCAKGRGEKEEGKENDTTNKVTLTLRRKRKRELW